MTQQLFSRAELREGYAELRNSANPFDAYLAGQEAGSRPTMACSLRRLARELVGLDARAVPWHRLRAPHLVQIRAWCSAQGYAPSTTNRYLAAARGVLGAAYELDLLDHEDYHRARAVRGVRGSRLGGALAGRHVSASELEQLATATRVGRGGGARGARDLAILALLAGGGLRRAEVCSLDVAAFAGRQIIVTGKGGRERIVPLAPGAADAVHAYLGRLAVTGEFDAGEPLVVATRGRRVLVRGQRLSAPQVRQVLSGLARRAAVAPLTPHDLRRTYAGALLDAGVDLPTVQRLMGHSSPVTTASYDRRDLRALEDAASRLWFPVLE